MKGGALMTSGFRKLGRLAMVAVFALVLGVTGFLTNAEAVTVTDNTPTNAASTGSAWTNPNNALSQDGAVATWKNTARF